MPQNTINPDAVCRQALQAKLEVYQAKEQFESVLKFYNDQVDSLINVIGLIKNRILELEGELVRKKATNQNAASKTEQIPASRSFKE